MPRNPRPTVVVAPTAYRGTLSAGQAAAAIGAGVRASWPLAEVVELPLSDGGDGFLETLLRARGGRLEWLLVPDALGHARRAPVGWLSGEPVAVLELARAVGIARLPAVSWRTASRAGTEGLGRLLRRALEEGARRILLGLGGSASSDGGAGLARALGFRFLDADGEDLPPGGTALARLARIDSPRRLPGPPEVELVAATDVLVPLLGPGGAARTFGPQKGAGPRTVAALERGLTRLAEVVRRDLGGPDLADLPGAGAAGGCAFGLAAFAGARLAPGSRLVADAVDLDSALRGAGLVLTGEGRLDAQSLRGKVVGEVVRRARRAGAGCLVLAGSAASGAELELNRLGAEFRPLPPGAGGSTASARAALRRAAEAACQELDRQG